MNYTSCRHLYDILKTSWKRLEDMLARPVYLQGYILKTSWRHLEDVFKMPWVRLEDVFARYLEDVSTRRRMTEANIFVLIKTSWRLLEDVFCRCMTKAYIFVLINISWRRLQDVFWRQSQKTSSRRLQDVFTKTNVCWVCSLHLVCFYINLSYTLWISSLWRFLLCWIRTSLGISPKFYSF